MDFAFVILKKIINQRTKKKEISRKQNESKTKNESKTVQASKKPQQMEQKPKKQKITKSLKLIIMSATLNSEQFQKYFAVHKFTNLIIEPDITIKHQNNQSNQPNKSRRGTRDSDRRRGNMELSELSEQKKQISITYSNLEDYRQGTCVFINEKSLHTVKQYYLEDFLPYFQVKAPNKNYEHKEEVRLEDRNYDWGIKLIQKANRDIQYLSKHNAEENHSRQQAGDILVFLPGLIEINRMKEWLIKSDPALVQKIVEVHSLFSEELYFKLFKSTVKNKIILATNIGQSSITLPNCKVVIDYCLNRKAVKNNKEGISRFTTTVASLSNLIQRKGRVGRVSDGTVYRMITKQEYETLQEFDVPEIKCVSLQMAILKTKKLESTSKNNIFQDVYEIFLNVLEPPQINSIQSAIDSLIHEDALEYVFQGYEQKGKQKSAELKRKINSGKKYDGKMLKITKVGEFMVSMPCDLGISKLILMGIKLGISSIIIDIAAIILSTKSFFCHEERRVNIEQFMHAIIGYDKGYNNDYLLRQRLFDHWRSKFYIPFREKHRDLNLSKYVPKKPNLQTSFRIFDFGEEVEFDQNYKIVQKFLKLNQTNDERDFCKNRGVYPNVMRQLLRMSETLKIRIQMIGVQKQKLNTFQVQAQLILICLMYAFPDLICQVSFETKKKQLPMVEFNEFFTNKLYVPLVNGLDNFELEGYLEPEKDFEVKEYKDSLLIATHDHILKKFLLPKNYNKAPSDNCSLLYKHCKLSKIKYAYEYIVYQGFRNITVLNESINKQMLISKDVLVPNQIQNRFLISHNVIESKGRYMIGANAMLSHFQLVIISMIVKKNIKVSLHASKQFFSHIQLNQKRFEIPLLLTQNQLALINKLRALSKRQKQEQIASYKQQFDKVQLKILSNLFTLQNRKPLEQDWEDIFVEQENKVQFQNLRKRSLEQHHHLKDQQWIPIQMAENRMKKNKGKPYHERYNDWKKYLFQSIETQYKLHITTEAILICGHCNANKKLVEIVEAHSFQFKTGLLKLNKFSGSWRCPEAKQDQIDRAGMKIYCTNHHHIGTSIDTEKAELDLKNIHLYVPFNHIYTLKSIQDIDHYYQIVNSVKTQGARHLKAQQQKFDEYECKICYSKQNYRKLFIRNELQSRNDRKNSTYSRDPLWNAVLNHLVSNAHIQNKQKLKRSINWK